MFSGVIGDKPVPDAGLGQEVAAGGAGYFELFAQAGRRRGKRKK